VFDYKQRAQTEEYKDNYSKIKGMTSKFNKKDKEEKEGCEDEVNTSRR
jgi:hypothetical protein